jgi:hypothetical protein
MVDVERIKVGKRQTIDTLLAKKLYARWFVPKLINVYV